MGDLILDNKYFLADDLERAVQLEELASAETNPQFKSQLLNLADAYRKLAANPRRPKCGPLAPAGILDGVSFGSVSAGRLQELDD